MDLNQFIGKFAAQFEDADTIEIYSDSIFRDLPTWDSMTAMCVQTMILDDYSVILSDHHLRSLLTVKDIFDFVINEKN